MLFALASIGLPGTGGFVGEVLILVSLFKTNTWVAGLATSSLIFGAGYMLYLYKRTIFGKLTKENLLKIQDVTAREIAVFFPLIILIIWMGLYPSYFLNFIHSSVANLLDHMESSLALSNQSIWVLK